MRGNHQEKEPRMKKTTRLVWAATVFLVACGYSGDSEDETTHQAAETDRAAESDDGEESSEQLAKNQTHRRNRAGSLLTLAYDAQTNSFTGAVENVGPEPLTGVRVEVHLSNGVELGPTSPADLAPGESVAVSLEASGGPFETWSAHAEVGGVEGDHEDEDGEHGNSKESGDGAESGEHGGQP